MPTSSSKRMFNTKESLPNVEDLTGMHICYVGAGVMGLHSAYLVSKRGATVTIIEKESNIGGVWFTAANKGSRVQILEPGYRLIPGKIATDFTQQEEVLENLNEIVNQLLQNGENKIYVNSTCTKVDNIDDKVFIHYDTKQVNGDVQTKITEADHVIFSSGGLREPVRETYIGEEHFNGPIIYGLKGEPDKLKVKGKHVLIVGMGAFAIENARECLFRGASHVTFVVRSRNIILPKIFAYMNWAMESKTMTVKEATERRKNTTFGQNISTGLNFVGTILQRPFRIVKTLNELNSLRRIFLTGYEKCHAEEALPDELRKFQEEGGTNLLQIFGSESERDRKTLPTMSDAFFVGYALGKITVIRGDIEKCGRDHLLTKDGGKIHGDIIMKNLGFKQDANWLQDVLPHDHMYEPSFLGNRAWLMKAERPTPTKSEIKNLYEQGFDVKTRDNSPTLLASAPYFAAFQTEIFSYFQANPDKLKELIAGKHIAKVPLGRSFGISMGLSISNIIHEVPELRERFDYHKIEVHRNIRRRYSFDEYINENKEWWKYCCKCMSGDEDAVPYLWEEVEDTMKTFITFPNPKPVVSELLIPAFTANSKL